MTSPVFRARPKTGYWVEFIGLVERGVNGASIAGLEKFARTLKVDVKDWFTFGPRKA